MIVLFIKSDLIRQQSLAGYVCRNCGTSGGIAMEFHQRYADFAGGKVYPSGVFGRVHCKHCGYTLPASQWTDDLHRAYVALKRGYKTPRRYWTGAIRTAIGFSAGLVLLTGVLSSVGHFQRKELARQEAAFNQLLTQPTPGITLATVSNGQPAYGVRRVSRVSNDAVWLRKYIGNRTLTDFYNETGWAALPDSDFSAEAIAYAKAGFASKGLKRIENMADKNKPYEGVIISVLNK